MALIQAVDAATPALGAIPPQAKVVLGYVGAPGHTPHIWTLTEVNAVRATGRQWWPIWVPAQGLMSAATGQAAARGMLAALPRYSVAAGTPCFFDVERSSWEASQAGVRAAVAAFKQAMRAAGYSRPLGYVPRAAGIDWIANWTNSPPAALPAGVIGQQYRSTNSWDFSVFDAALLQATPTNTIEEDDMSAQDVNDINGHTDDTAAHIIHQIEASMEARLSDHNAAMEQKFDARFDALEKKLGSK